MIQKQKTQAIKSILVAWVFCFSELYFFCRVLDIRVSNVMHPDALYPRCLAAILHFVIQKALGVGKEPVVLLQSVAMGHILLQTVAKTVGNGDMRTGLTKQEKTTEIYFDEKDPTIFIRTHNTDLKNRLTAYNRKHPAVCKLTDVDPDTGCKEFEIEKGRFSFRLTAPYREERRRAASEAAKNE